MARPATGQVVIDERGERPVFALRFRAYGKRRYVTLGTADEGWTDERAKEELANVLADVRRGIWRPPTTNPKPQPEPESEPSFHVFASAWVERRRGEVAARTAEHWVWALSNHLLPFFAAYLLSQFTPRLVEEYKAVKLREREERAKELERWKRASPARRGKRPERGLSNGSVNKTLKVLAQVLDDAIEYGYLAANPARGKKRRLKASKPQRTWLTLEEVQAVIRAAGGHRALVATMILAGLRISELCNLRWRDVDLAGGKLRVVESKTDAGERTIDLSPGLLDELKLHRANARFTAPDDFVFATRNGTRRNRSNVTRQILEPAVTAASAALAAAGKPAVQDGVTNHTLRRTFASLLYEAEASPAYVMSQMGHTSSALALEVYAKVMERKRDTGERMDALIRGADWAAMGSNDETEPVDVLEPDNEKAA
jgi:integrase